MRGLPIGPPCLPSAGAPQGPRHKYRLEQESDPSAEIRVQTEGSRVGDELGDVAREHDDEERGDNPAHLDALARKRQEAHSQCDFDDARRDDDGFWKRQPGRNLGDELIAVNEVADPGE